MFEGNLLLHYTRHRGIEISDLLQSLGWGSSLWIHFHRQLSGSPSASLCLCRTKMEVTHTSFKLTHTQYHCKVPYHTEDTNPCVAPADNEHLTLTVSES